VRRVLLLASLALAGSACRTPMPEPAASVLLVTIDTLRADRVGAYGAGPGRTPQIDALAAQGLVLEDAWAPVPLTLPSHATILSGLEPPHHGVHDNGAYVFPNEPATLATVLAGRGYATGAFVGAYVLDRRFGLARGFAHYDDRIERNAQGASVLESERRGGEVAAAAEAWIGAQTKPFFAWVHFYDPHAPYDPPSPQREAFAGRAYEGEVAYADASFGRVLAAARARAGERLLVAVTADHGEGLGEHGERTHGFFVYGATLRVPLVLAGPGFPPGERRRGIARSADILPTLLARLAVPPPPRLDGVDLLGARPNEAYAESLYPQTLGWAPLRALRVGSLRYVDAPRPELYDLADDPGETRNRLAERSQEAERLRAALAALRAQERAPSRAGLSVETAERLTETPCATRRTRSHCGSASRRRAGPPRAATTRAPCRRCARWCATSPGTPSSVARSRPRCAARAAPARRRPSSRAITARMRPPGTSARWRWPTRETSPRRWRAPSAPSRSIPRCPRSTTTWASSARVAATRHGRSPRSTRWCVSTRTTRSATRTAGTRCGRWAGCRRRRTRTRRPSPSRRAASTRSTASERSRCSGARPTRRCDSSAGRSSSSPTLPRRG
jgi:arylsulfatase A-like enzyme